MIARRTALITLCALAACPCFAQQPAKVPRIGVLTFAPSPQLENFYQGLRELGYVEGKNVLIERRFTGSEVGKARVFAQELAALKVDVILAYSSTFVEATLGVTPGIPVVFVTHNDPVGSGHVASLAHPGGKKGADPATMAVEQPTRFELVVNRRSAKALGIAIPRELLVRADRVIE